MVNQLLNQLEEVKEESFLSNFVPVVNTREGEYAYHIELDLPGIKKEEIDLQVSDNILTIKAIRKMKNEAKKRRLLPL